VPVTALVSFYHESGTLTQGLVTLPAESRVTLLTPFWVPAGDFGVGVWTQGGPPIAVERSQYGHTNWTVGTSGVGSPGAAQAWWFSEGASGAFDTYFLVMNPSGADAALTFTFVTEGGAVVSHPLSVSSGTRRTLAAAAVPGLGATAFRTVVESTAQVVVERATYWAGVQGTSALGAPLSAALAVVAAETVGGPVWGLAPEPAPSPPAALYQTLGELVPLGPLPDDGGPGVAGEAGAPLQPTAVPLPWHGGHLTLGRRFLLDHYTSQDHDD
jgi:hypothetical protein